MRKFIVDFNEREFIRPGLQSIALQTDLNPDIEARAPVLGEEVLIVDEDGVEYVADVRHGLLYPWVADIVVVNTE